MLYLGLVLGHLLNSLFQITGPRNAIRLATPAGFGGAAGAGQSG